jgi:hypothetical protein
VLVQEVDRLDAKALQRAFERAADMRMAAVAAPAYFERNPPPQTPGSGAAGASTCALTYGGLYARV